MSMTIRQTRKIERKISHWMNGTALHQHHHRCVLLATKASTGLLVLMTLPALRDSSKLFSRIIVDLLIAPLQE
jgi:hypothetical protein